MQNYKTYVLQNLEIKILDYKDSEVDLLFLIALRD